MNNLIRFIFLVPIFVSQSIFAIEIVSLGSGCMTARAARYNNVRSTAYPFDWLISSMQALKNAIQDDFKQVLLPEQTHERDDNKAVVDGYGFVFIHDFATIRNPITPIDSEIMPVHELVPDWRDSIGIVQQKFNRRLERLLKLLDEGEPVALVRYGEMDRDEAEQFVALLKQKFPCAKAVLVVIGTTPEFQEPWNISHVRNFYIDEKEFRNWDGPVWADIMCKIGAMNPKGWSDDTHVLCNYVLTSPAYNPGLFCVFHTVLGALDLYDRGYITGFTIDFEDKGWYYDKEHGLNWWDYYFEPMQLGSWSHDTSRKLFPTYQKIALAYQAQFEMSRERAHELIHKYIHVQSHIVQQVDNFCKEHFDNFFVIGVHYRGSDKLGEAPVISYPEIVASINLLLAEHSTMPIKIFVATDDASFSTYIKEQFPNLIVMRDALRSDNSAGVHTRADFAPYQKGEDAIIDCLLLSRCSVLMKTVSYLSDSSLLFSPEIPVIRLHTSYSE